MKRLSRIGLFAVGAFVLLLGSLIVNSQNQDSVSQTQLLGLRLDIETLADRAFGGGTRPDQWTGNADAETPNILADIWFDNELVADAIFGVGVRPDDWAGAASNRVGIVARNVRHDAELSADNLVGAGLRPEAWSGPIDPITLCSRNVMNIAFVLQNAFGAQLDTAPGVTNFCLALQIEMESEFIELSNTGAPAPAEIAELNLAVRGDLERLADELLGLDTRPDGWTRNTDLNSPSLLRDNYTDLQLLADETLGPGQRPEGAIDNVNTASLSAVRNLRYDLELLADETMGDGMRPRGWQGAEVPLARCHTNLQSLVQLLQFVYGFELPESAATGSEYCREVFVAASFAAENPPVPEEGEQQAIDQRYVAESRNAFAYLDLAATQYMGSVPWGTEIRAWYRNFNNSTMMFVSGQDFALYIDRRWTTLSEEVFLRLPSLEGVQPLTFCDASWCNGPAPTPTPTGSGPLLQIITGATPPATIAPDQIVQEGKAQVGWNNIRVNYVEQFPDRGVAQVTLEICGDTTQIACEPVLSIFDNNTGFEVAPIGSSGGLNLYELPYGYSQNLLIEGATYFSTDIWLNDPTIG